MSISGSKVLVVGPSWVGDMVMAQSLFKELKSVAKVETLDVLAPAWTAALIDRMPEVDALVEAKFEHGKLGIRERFGIAKGLRSAAYDRAILLPNSLKSSLVPFLARIPVRTGFLGEQRWGLVNDIRKLDKQTLPMTVQRFVALGRDKEQSSVDLSSITIPELQVEQESVENACMQFSLATDKPILSLCPGAEFGKSKQWPTAHYASVANHYLQLGWQVWMFGSDKDIPVCEEINKLCNGQLTLLAGQTSLPQAIDLMSLSSLVVSNDSGLMHIAAALSKPLVAVYGSTDPGHTPPLSANHRIARTGIECSPCFKRECPLNHHECMQALSPDLVINLASDFLAEESE